MRLACFYIPMFPLAARLRSEPDLRDDAVAIVEGSGSHVHIVAATRRARKKAIHAGMSLTQARAILPKLIARDRDAACEEAAQEALLEVAETFSPRIEDAGGGLVYVDITGMERHFDGETSLGKAALRAFEAASLPGRVGIAGSKLAARVAAELPQSPVVVAHGEEELFLAPLPLARLTPELDAAAMLRRFGLSSIGDLARLPESEIAARLGETGRALHRAARGIDSAPLIPRALPPEFREGMQVEWPLVALEPFLFIANAALDRLASRLEMQGFAAKRIELSLTLDPDGFDARGIDLPAPTRDVKTLLTLLRLDLEKRPPGAPVVGFTLTAIPDRPRRAQLSLFGPAAVSPEKLATTIARLVSILGEGRVGMPVTVDGHLPDRYAITEFDPPPPPNSANEPPPARAVAAVRVFRPSVSVEITTTNGETEVHGEGIEGTVRRSSGPWLVEEGWWRVKPAFREYWDLETFTGIFRLFRNDAQWVAEAQYGI